MTIESQKLALIQMILALQDNDFLSALQKFVEKNTAFQAFRQPVSIQQKTSSGSIQNKTDRTDTSFQSNPRQFGCGKGIFSNMAPDFDETPPGFEDYMPASSRKF